MTQQVESANKWVYFIQNLGWLVSIPVALTLIYSNMSSRIDAQEKEITELRSQITDINTNLTTIINKQGETTVILTRIQTLMQLDKKMAADK